MLSEISEIDLSGRWIPSKIVSISPGPNSTDKGLPVRVTGSPTVTPATHVIVSGFHGSVRQNNCVHLSPHKLVQ